MNEKVIELIKKEFKELTSVEKIAFNEDVNKDWIIVAPTGSGKTEAALFPIFSEILEKNLEKISCLYITPLRSLNRDLQRRIKKYCNYLDLEVDVRHSDTTTYERKLQVQHPPDLLITTIETFQIALISKKISEFLKNVRFVIIDEIHEVLDSKRGSQLIFSLEMLKRINDNFSIKLISATLSNFEKVERLFKRRFTIISGIEEKKFEFKIFLEEDFEKRLERIFELVKNHETTLIFTNTRESAEILSRSLKERFEDIKIETYHSSLERDVRREIEKKILEKEVEAVVATSSLQLGIDIGHVDLAIQYQSPRQVNQLIQRVGRASHKIDKTSKGIIVCSNLDDYLESITISNLALEKKIEDFYYFNKPLDVLFHQISGMLIKNFKLNIEEVYNFVKKISIFEDLTKNEFINLLRFGEKINVWKIENGLIRRKKGCFKYFFNNLSTIPSRIEYKVVNVANKKSIGSLDESFVKMELDENKSFIMKGECWKVVSIDDANKIINVENSENIDFAIPSWKGELLDVPYEVATKAASLRERFENKIIEEQKKISIVPNDKNILVDIDKDLVVINSCFGSRVNETLAILISSILSYKTFEKVNYETSAYRITIYSKVSKETIEEIINIICNYPIEKLIKESVKNSKSFSVKFLELAKRFGIIEDESKLNKKIVEKIITEYSNTIIENETINQIITSKLDIEKTKEVFNNIKNGTIKIYFNNFLTPISKIEIAEKYGYVKAKESKEVFEEFKQRIYNTRLFLFCTNCKRFKISVLVKDFDKLMPCPYCESTFIAPVKNLKKIDKNIKAAANFFVDYGKKFLIVLAGRGVGVETAIRILTNNRNLSEEELLKIVYEEEKRYIRTKKYWKI
ncbi:MAG: DEAD/DEAH box helicase [Candidatus Aenigmarchaeota archaeon]|nr:DEAD/DEAH box helicase [Candidatus Aenigmarchaeota archaeon]MDW8149609.1 DEAD/DEAH box helicase [Candidatus Aenigmarchaeota archaeon]